jgi:hypothetical protein
MPTNESDFDIAQLEPWPRPLHEAAYHGVAGDIVRAIAPHTESDDVALLVHLLVFFGVAAGREPHFVVDGSRHALNEFAVIVGDSSKARKGTAGQRIRRVFERAAPDFVERIVKGLSSAEGLVDKVRDDTIGVRKNGEEYLIPGESDKRLCVNETEFASALGMLTREGNVLSPTLRDAWDGMPLGTLTKTAKTRCQEPHIGLIGHITQAELLRTLTRTEAANGFGNRFAWFLVRRARYLPWGGDEPNLNDHVARLKRALDTSRHMEVIGVDSEVRAMWETIYRPLSDAKPGLVGELVARGEAHVRRFAAIYAALDGEGIVRRSHLLAALALWDYAEDSARCIWGATLGDDIADEVLRALRAAGAAGMTMTELRDLFSRNVASGRIRQAVAALVRRRLARTDKASADGPGRPSERAYATAPPAPAEVSYRKNVEAYAYDINDINAEIRPDRAGQAN